MKVALVGYGYWGINLAKTINANPNYENVILPLPAGLSLARKIK